MALERAEIVLPARGRFDLRATALDRGREPPPPYRWHEGRRPVLERAEELADGSVHLLRIWPEPRGVVLEVTGWDAREIEVLAPLAARVRRALSLDVDLADFHRMCRADPLLRPLARAGMGRVLRGTSVFEDVVGVLAATDGRSRAATSTIGRLVRLGRRVPAQPGLRAFPSPRILARTAVSRLASVVGLGERASPIVRLSREIAAGRRDLEALRQLDARETACALREIRGLGPLDVARLLLVLGHLDETVRDGAARSFARRALGGDGAPLERWLRRQAPWRGLALWLASRADGPDASTPLKPGRLPEVPASRAARRTGHGTARSRVRGHQRRRPAS
jgi:DNA-3-methyladenine glycosylase II